MIRPLSLEDTNIALQVLSLQLASYMIEAELIGMKEIPPLQDSIQTLQQAKETFLGHWEDGVLNGAISYTREEDAAIVCRMMVHPEHFRKGIASRLLETVFMEEPDARVFKVSTGKENLPAVRLYTRHGFVEKREQEVAPGIFLTHFEKNNDKKPTAHS